MLKLYRKSKIGFALVCIGIYILGSSAAEEADKIIGYGKLLTLAFHLAMTVFLLAFICRNNLIKEYGLCSSPFKAKEFLFYIPLAVIVSVNLWFGVTINTSPFETALFVCSMLCVGFLEEIIFRGFLFKAMAEGSAKAAVIVSSITFGIGHIINLFNGSGAELLPNLCQIVYATAAGFMFVILFYKGKSLLPCIITHSLVNALSVVSDSSVITDTQNIITAAVLTVTAGGYALILNKRLK